MAEIWFSEGIDISLYCSKSGAVRKNQENAKNRHGDLKLCSELYEVWPERHAGRHGRPQGEGKTGIPPPLEIETKKQKFLENVKSAVLFWLVGLILAMTVIYPYSHCTRVRFIVLVTCSYEFAVHQIRFFACRGRLQNSNCSTIALYCVTITWQQIFEDALQVTVVRVLPNVTIEHGQLGRKCETDCR